MTAEQPPTYTIEEIAKDLKDLGFADGKAWAGAIFIGEGQQVITVDFVLDTIRAILNADDKVAEIAPLEEVPDVDLGNESAAFETPGVIWGGIDAE